MNARSKTDLLKEKLDLIFANRHEHLDFFTKLIAGEKLQHSLLAVRGIGGIGKTMLLGAFQRICTDHEVPTAILDVGMQRSIAEILRSMRDQLNKPSFGFSSSSFDVAVERYIKIDQDLRKSAVVSVRALDFISKAGVLSPNSSLDRAEQHEMEEEDYSLVINKIYQQLDKADADFFVNPDEFLSKELLKDINQYCHVRHLCVMFDRYEVVPTVLDRWIRRDFFANLSEPVLVVISGRSPLPPEWGKWRPLIKNVELSPFPQNEIQELLQLFGITSKYLVEQIARFSGGVPLAISLAAQLVAERKTEDFSMVSEKYDVIERLVEVLVRDASPELEKALEVCSILRWFNEETIKNLFPDLDDRTYKKISGYEFIRHGRYGLELHDRVRDFICMDLNRREPARYRKLNKLASEYYGSLIDEGGLQDQRLLILEKTYHQLRADETVGMKSLHQVFSDAALLIQPSFCQSLIEVAESAGLQDDIHKLWIEYFKGSLARQVADFEEAERIFQLLANNALVETNKDLKAELYYFWGVALWYLCRFPESLEISQQAVKLNQDLGKKRFENRALGVVGLTLDRIGKFQEGLLKIEQMLTQATSSDDLISQAYALNSMGYFSWHKGDWDVAEGALYKEQELWVKLRSKFGESYALGHLGRIYADIYDYPLAQEFLNNGFLISQQGNNHEMQIVILINLSAYSIYTGNYEKAIGHCTNGVELARRLHHPYFEAEALNIMGDALDAMERKNDAIKKYQESLKISEKIGASWVHSKNLIGLYRCELSMKSKTLDFSAIENYVQQQGFYDQLANLYNIKADELFVLGDSDTSVYYYKACSVAIKYNWHIMDRVIRSLLSLPSRKESKTSRVKNVWENLLDQWSITDKGLCLVDEEKKASRIYKGGGINNDSVEERISKALDNLKT